MSKFREKYIKGKDSSHDSTKKIHGFTQSQATTQQYPSDAIRREVVDRIFHLSKMMPQHSAAIVTGCVNTIAAIYGNEVAQDAANGITASLGIEMKSAVANTIEEAMETINKLGLSQDHSALQSPTPYDPSGLFTTDGQPLSSDISAVLAKAANSKMVMN